MGIRRVEVIDDLVQVKNVFMSVFDKRELDVLAPKLIELCPDVMIYSTGGTHTRLVEILGDDAEKHLKGVDKYTGMKETKGGLVKSLHHMLFLGYLTETYCPEHQIDLEMAGAVAIDLLVGNLYPFEEVIAKPGIDIEDARGNFDVGGPSALRAAAKNWHRVMAVVDPADYAMLITELQNNNGSTTVKTRFELQKKAWTTLGVYDTAIANYNKNISFEDAKKPYIIKNPSGGK